MPGKNQNRESQSSNFINVNEPWVESFCIIKEKQREGLKTRLPYSCQIDVINCKFIVSNLRLKTWSSRYLVWSNPDMALLMGSNQGQITAPGKRCLLKAELFMT